MRHGMADWCAASCLVIKYTADRIVDTCKTRAHSPNKCRQHPGSPMLSHLPTSTSRVVHTTPGRFSGFGEHATSYQRAPLKPSASAVQKATHNGNATYGGHEKTKPRRCGGGRCNTGVCGQDSRARDKTRLKQARHACLDHPQRRPSCPRSGSAHLSCSGRPKASVTESGDPNCR